MYKLTRYKGSLLLVHVYTLYINSKIAFRLNLVTVGENINWFSPLWKWYGTFLKKKKKKEVPYVKCETVCCSVASELFETP